MPFFHSPFFWPSNYYSKSYYNKPFINTYGFTDKTSKQNRFT
jgi:hypothetical protein